VLVRDEDEDDEEVEAADLEETGKVEVEADDVAAEVEAAPALEDAELDGAE
jgi:hypothetical protein